MPKLSAIQRDIVVNYAAQAWVALMSLAFVPLYIRYLGIEAYGVIGLFALLQAMLMILDLGMTPTLMREMSRYTGGGYDVVSIRDLLRSVEVAALVIALAIMLAVWIGSGWLAGSWFRSETIPDDVLARALSVMGLVAALRFVEGVFRGSIIGLQRQVLFNALNALMATVRAVGAIAILAGVSASLDAYFLWQALISLVTLGALRAATYASLPQGERPGRFSPEALQAIWRFAAGMLGISLLTLALTQVDKLLLSRLLTLSDYACYALAAVIAASLETLVAPLFQALTPRFSRLHATGDEAAFTRLYHQGAQLVSVTAGPVALLLIAFPDVLLSAWTHDPALAARTAPLLRVLALGYLLNILMWVPYQAQLAHRWTGLTIRVNVVAVALIVPLLLWAVPRFGTLGAAWVWAGLNAMYFLVNIQFMHRRILTAEKWHWYFLDVLLPLSCAAGIMFAARSLLDVWQRAQLLQLALIGIAWMTSTAIAILSAPALRRYIQNELLRPAPRDALARVDQRR